MPNWNQVLLEIQSESASKAAEAQAAVDTIRRKYLGALHQHTGRNIIAYYSGFLSKPGIRESEINDEDKNGFMMAIHGLDRSKGLDLILHTQGGSIAATESIVDYLYKMFTLPNQPPDIRAIVPQIAMSAGTMIACSCRRILMAKHSNLGPTDPHLAGTPAYGVLQEFKRACDEVRDDKTKIPIWQAIIGQYPPTFLSQCENAIKWSNRFVQRQLERTMFAGDPKRKQKARKIVRKLTDFSGNRSHERHIDRDECRNFGLLIDDIEANPLLQDLVLTVHHCYMHALMNTPSFKMIENHLGMALVKQQRITAVQ